jgi:hypothetical protein
VWANGGALDTITHVDVLPKERIARGLTARDPRELVASQDLR